MSIYGAMFSGVSGLAAQAQALGMISDNISNVNTVGYKGTQARFQTLVTEAATTASYSPGGVRSVPYSRIDRQGLLQGSGSPTDLAIVGNGFFVVNEAATPTSGADYLFTRAGNFNIDSVGNLTTPSGYFLQGWRLDSAGNLPANTSLLTGLESVNVATITGAARATSEIALAANLPAQDAVGGTHGNSVQLFDKQGVTQSLSLTWTKTAANTWDLTGDLTGGAQIASDDTTGATFAASAVALATLTFNADGTIASIAGGPLTVVNASNELEFYVDYDNDAATTSTQDRQLVTMNLGTLNQGNGITQYAGSFATTLVNQDGLQFGTFTGVSVDQEGTVTALFDNGQRRPIFQLPLATFSNPNGLQAQAGNVYLQTDRSGVALLQEANTNGAGRLAGNSLESSTVDLAEEFTNMIITQRAYSASARVITTADEMLEELIRIRR